MDSKIDGLKQILKPMERVLVAFSGGKDSFFLLSMALEVLGGKGVVPLFIQSNFTSTNDRGRVQYFQQRLGIEVQILKLDLGGEENIFKNPRDRCYLCKRAIFKQILAHASRLNITNILDGTTHSDLDEYRPGLLALEELQVNSPLRAQGITSAEVADYLKMKGIDDYYVTSSTCLATRFPYGIELTEKMISQFDEVETYLVKEKIFPVRVRYIPDGVRIEVHPDLQHRLLRIRRPLIDLCKKIGLQFITLDLEGIKSGVWD